MKSVRLITDGSCIGNPGRGGWAAILRYGEHKKELSGSEDSTTNNRMEMTAVLEGLKAIREPCRVTVEIDSEYVKKGITRWIKNWKRRSWKTSTGGVVKNQDLWQSLEAALTTHKVTWVWVRGHGGHADNNRCDRLARAAARGHSKKKRASNPHRPAAARPQNRGSTPSLARESHS